MQNNNLKNKKSQKWASLTLIVFSFFIVCLSGCKKYLDASPDKQLTTPKTIQDLRAILDYNRSMNSNYSPYGAIASDDYYVTDVIYEALPDVVAKNNYAWGLIAETADQYLDWQYNYQRLFYVNVVLDYFDKVTKVGATEADINSIKGEALFYRAFTMFTMAQVYALPYNPTSAAVTLGIPYKLTADINEQIVRPSLQQNYQQMVEDLQEAIPLLRPSAQSLLRPDRPAACLALANVHLIMQQFGKAESYADSCLKYQNQLIDYNDILLSSSKPFQLFNKEVIWQADLATNTILSSSRAITDTLLYQSFENNDLRKLAYFKVNGSSPAIFKGYYNGGTGVYFAGLAVDEAYLVKAECEARKDDLGAAMATLNTLLVNRYDNTFVPISTSNQQQAIDIILEQRRKELCFRGGIRWMDIRRLNQFDNSKITLTRKIAGQVYKLLPSDTHFAFLIPQNAIDNSHIKQNAR